MMNPRFIHLRIHTEYSIVDGLIQIKPLLKEAAKLRMPALAVTEQGNIFSVVKFYEEATSNGVKPLIGADVWLHNEKQASKPFRLTLLCQNNQGYKNLLKLLSFSYQEGQKTDRPMITRQWLESCNQSLIVLSGAQHGDIGQALLAQNDNLAQKNLEFWQKFFPGRYYLELQRVGQVQEEPYIQAALALAESARIPVVATNDVRFLHPEDYEAHEARVCIHDGSILSDPQRTRSYTEQQYFRSQEEMEQIFADIPEALENTVEIAKRCNVKLTLGQHFLPYCAVPEGFTVENYLSHLSKQGLEERLKTLLDAESPTFQVQRRSYDSRLERELDVITKMGFAGYFLIVADFTRWARDNDVPVGPGRGSGPGSLVAYALNITDLDPLAHDLLFERFLNPDRVSLPDFDIDFCIEGRDRVIDYVMQKHGRECVSQIITYGTMAARAVVRDVGRVLGYPYGFVDKLAKLIPFELGMTLEKALEQEPLLSERCQQEEEVRTLMELARKLEGTTRNVGKHAGGLVIAPGKLTDFIALYCEPDSTEHVVTQLDKDDVESIGLVKFDFLGLKTLTIMQHALKYINHERAERGESQINLSTLPKDDVATFKLLKACKTNAIFQLESRGMRDLVKRLQPDCFEDLIALVALFRPGPLQSGMVDDFINRKHGRARVLYPHPKLEPVLRPTYGVILYQEQVMQIAQVLAGYTLGSADLLRRAMGKKKPEEMAEHREIFCQGAIARGVSSELANQIFDLMEKFAGYGFNKSHSASYALIAYQTAWLKAHYPAAFMAAVLTSDMDNTDKIVHYIEESKALGLHVAAPDINESHYTFTVIDDTHLRFGLGAIKGVGEAAIESIISSRKQQGAFQDLFDFCSRIDLRKANKRVMEALIKSGTLDKFGVHRAALLATLPQALQQAEQTLHDAHMGQQDLLSAFMMNVPTKYNEATEWSEEVRLQGEKETLGFYLSGHPIQRYNVELNFFVTCKLSELQPSQHPHGVVAGIIIALRMIQTKRGDRMAVFTIDDGTGQVDVLCFADVYQKYRELINKDQLVIVSGEVGVDNFNDSYRVTCNEIYSMEQARERYAKFLQITVTTTEQNAQPNFLATLLTPYRGGNCAVVVRTLREGVEACVRLGEAWRIKPSDGLLQILRERCLEGNVEVVY